MDVNLILRLAMSGVNQMSFEIRNTVDVSGPACVRL